MSIAVPADALLSLLASGRTAARETSQPAVPAASAPLAAAPLEAAPPGAAFEAPGRGLA